MSVQMPTQEQLRAVARECGLSLDDASVDSFRALYTTYVEAYNIVAAMPDEVPRVKYPRTPGYRPGQEENKYNILRVARISSPPHLQNFAGGR